MNQGTKIIVIMGVAAALVFTANFFAGLHAHKKIAEYHLIRYEVVQKTAIPGSDWINVRKILSDGPFQFEETVGSDGGMTVVCKWEKPENKAHVQSERLGVPTSAEIRIGRDGKVVSVSGIE